MEALLNGKYFLSCDWGTSNFRLQVVDAGKLVPVARVSSDEGIATIYAKWKQTDRDRFQFFRSVIDKHIAVLELQSGASLKDVPVVISGMASSTIGMKEIAYKPMPFDTDGSDLNCEMVDNMIIVSGARTDNDVMRGEETQVIGISEQISDDGFIILPGTHSKHVVVTNGRAVSVQTFMTGELFQLLSEKSMLSASVIQSQNFEECKDYFAQGIEHSQKNNFLNSIFSVRTNILLDKLSGEENYFYMSGLVIGEELNNFSFSEVNIIGSKIMNELYTFALGIINNKINVTTVLAEEAIIRGQYKILTLPRQ